MKTREEWREAAREIGDLLREERRADDAALTEELMASERDFEALVTASEEPGLFERVMAWLRDLELPTDLFFVSPPVAVRGKASLRKLVEGAQ